MKDKVVLITGGTAGIGRATAEGLASMGARVGIVGRDRGRADAAAADIVAKSGNHAVDVFTADMSALDEVRGLADDVWARYSRLDVLINNVGGMWARRQVTIDGFERTFAVNHLAPFLLTNLLLNYLKASAPARIVNLSSGAQTFGRVDFDDLQSTRDYSAQRAYAASKLANVMFTYELARRLDGSGVTANVLHPGMVRTNFGTEDPTPVMRVLLPVVRPLLKSPEQGARTSIFLASSPSLEGVTGCYFVNNKAKRSSRRSYDVGQASRLWQVSAELVGLASANEQADRPI